MPNNVIVLEPGQSVIVPPGVGISSIIVNQGAVIESDCENLPAPDEYVCIRYNFAKSSAGGDPAALQDMTLNYIKVGGVTYTFNLTVLSAINIKDTINAATGAVFKVYSASLELNAFDERVEFALAVRVPSLLKDSIIFNMSGTGYPGPPGFNLNFTDQPDCACLDSTAKEEYYCDINL